MISAPAFPSKLNCYSFLVLLLTLILPLSVKSLASTNQEKSDSGLSTSSSFDTSAYEHAVVIGDHMFYVVGDTVWSKDSNGQISYVYEITEDYVSHDWGYYYFLEMLYTENGRLYVVELRLLAEPYYHAYSYQLIEIDIDTAESSIVSSHYYPYGSPSDGYPTINDVVYSYWFDGEEYFVAEGSLVGEELWRLEGIGADRRYQLVGDINPGAESSQPANFYSYGGVLYFTAYKEGVGREVWKLNEGGVPEMVADINPGAESSFSSPDGWYYQGYDQYGVQVFYGFSNNVYFVADHQEFGRELWGSDGTRAGTYLVLDALPGESGFIAYRDTIAPIFMDFQNINTANGFYFRARQFGDQDNSLWISNGTEIGTRKVNAVGSGIIGDFVWLDDDGDGFQDPGERGLAGVEVQLLSCDGALLNKTTTSTSGRYLFGNIVDGSYQVKFLLPDGFEYSPQGVGHYKKDSNADESSGLTRCLPIKGKQVRKAIDAGMVKASPPESLQVIKAIYFSNQKKLWVRVSSTVEPEGTALLTLDAKFKTNSRKLGSVFWRDYAGFYQNRWLKIDKAPEAITITSSSGVSITAEVEIQ
ncbi:SdrD B-like domain-containing protein [Halioxenophilus aromaticivorans]